MGLIRVAVIGFACSIAFLSGFSFLLWFLSGGVITQTVFSWSMFFMVWWLGGLMTHLFLRSHEQHRRWMENHRRMRQDVIDNALARGDIDAAMAERLRANNAGH